jgi:hypothetical protein
MRYCANCRAPMCGTGADERIPERPKYGFGFEGAALKENQAAAPLLRRMGGYRHGVSVHAAV